MTTLTPRLKIPYPDPTDPADVPSDNGAMASVLDVAATYDQGALGSRPLPGVPGRFYMDTATQIVYLDIGSTWIPLNGAPKIPPGTMFTTARSAPDAGYLFADGSAVSRTTYADLFAAIGTGFGAGNGSTTFNLPNAIGRVLLGGAPADLGKTGGASSVILAAAQMPPHQHGGATGATAPGGTTDTQGYHSHGGVTYGMNGANPHQHWNPLMGVLKYTETAEYQAKCFSPDPSNVGANWPNAAADINHGHQIGGDGNHAHNLAVANHGHTIAMEGGGAAHENMPPYVTVAVEIKT